MTNQEIKTVGQTIAQETQIGGNTAARVGGVVEGIGVALDNKDAANGYYQATISGGTITVNAPNYLLGSGGNLRIKMPSAGTTASTLTIGNASNVQLWYNGATVSAQNTWEQDEIISVFYDGTRFMASNSQGGGGKAEKIKYDNSQSGLAADNVQGALDESANNIFTAAYINKNTAFNISGKIYNGGTLATRTSVTSTNKISLEGAKLVSYKLYLNNAGQAVSFFDANNNFLSSISITAPSSSPSLLLGNIDVTAPEYANAKYVAFSCYNYNASTRYAIIRRVVVDEVIKLSKDVKNAAYYNTDSAFNIANQVYKNGSLVARNNISSSDKISLKDITSVSYRLKLNNEGQAVSFFDANGNYLSALSVSAPSSSAIIMEGEIDITLPIYSDAAFVAFSCYGYYASYYGRLEKTIATALVEETAKINNRLGEYAEFNMSDMMYNGGVLSGRTGVTSTKKYYIQDTEVISYSLRLNNTGQIISFFDSNGSYLPNISITPSSSSAVRMTGYIDLTDASYSNVTYVAFSTYGYNSANDYVILGDSESIEKRVNELEKSRPFLTGKRFCALGDSITDGVGNNSYSWYDMLLQRYGSENESLNFAETGQCLRTMADLCTADNMANIDICFVSGGTNQLSNYRLGTIDDDPTPDRWQSNTSYNVGDKVLGGTMEEHGWTTHIMAYLYWYECITAGTSGTTEDASVFNTALDSITNDGTVQWKCIGNPSWYSDMKGICRRVLGFNPKIQIIWIVPIKKKSDASINVPANWANASKFQAIRDFCKAYSIRMIDLQSEFQLNEWTKDAIMNDNLHPNAYGYKLIQDIVCSHIE